MAIAAEETMRQVRVPLSDVLASGGSITMDDVHDAADGGDDAVTHFMAAEQSGPRVDAQPDPLLGQDLRPIEGSREATALVDEAAMNGTQPLEQAPPQAPAAPTPTEPIAGPEAQRGRRGMRVTPTTRFNERYRYSNQDFYGERGPDIYSADALGEKLYVPRAGELPMGLFASYAQTNQAQRAEIKKSIADILSGTEVSKTADPYQPAFTKLVTDWQNNFVTGISEQYGGNKDLAWREIAMRGSDANKAWVDGHRAMDALGQFVKFQWADAQAYINSVMKGDINTTPEQKQRAIDVFYGIGNLKGDEAGGDFVKLLEDTEALKRDMNTAKWVNERVLPMAPEVYRKIMDEPVAEMVGGKRYLRMRTREEADEEFYRIIGKEGSTIVGVPEEEIEKVVRAVIPPVKSDTYTMQQQQQGAAGSGGAPRASARNVRVDFRPYYDRLSASGKPAPNLDPKAKEATLSFTRYEETGDREHPVKEVTVSDGKGPIDIPMRDWQLTYNPARGGFFIVGTSLDETGKRLLRGFNEKVTSLSASDGALVEGVDREAEEIWQKHRLIRAVPADANSSIVSTYYGSSDPYAATARIVGMPVEEYRNALKTESGRRQIAQRMGLPVGEATRQVAAQQQPEAKPRTVIQNGVTYTLNPATGQYE